MRVVLVCPYSLSRPGGVQGQVLGLSRALRALGVDARVVAPCDGPPPAPGVVVVGPSVDWDSNGSVAPIATGKAVARRTIEALRSIDPHVVHLHEPCVPGPTLTTLIGHAGPMVGTFHIAGEVARGYITPALRPAVARLAVGVAVSDAARATAERTWGGSYRVLWNGIDVERFSAPQPWPTERPSVLFVGRHEPRKGLGVLLDAWRGIGRDATLWVVGSGPGTERLRHRGIERVEWLGRLGEDELRRRLRGATAFCAPSTGGESFGIVLLEAMAAGTPVVASDITGYANVARRGREGLLVPPDDPMALRSALQRVLDDAALRERLVAAGYARAEEFSMPRLAEAYRECYEQARAPSGVR